MDNSSVFKGTVILKKIDRHVHSQAAERLALARYVKQEREMALDAKDSDGAIDFLSYWQRTLWFGSLTKAEQNIIAQTDIKLFNDRIGKAITESKRRKWKKKKKKKEKMLELPRRRWVIHCMAKETTENIKDIANIPQV